MPDNVIPLQPYLPPQFDGQRIQCPGCGAMTFDIDNKQCSFCPAGDSSRMAGPVLTLAMLGTASAIAAIVLWLL